MGQVLDWDGHVRKEGAKTQEKLKAIESLMHEANPTSTPTDPLPEAAPPKPPGPVAEDIRPALDYLKKASARPEPFTDPAPKSPQQSTVAGAKPSDYQRNVNDLRKDFRGILQSLHSSLKAEGSPKLDPLAKSRTLAMIGAPGHPKDAEIEMQGYLKGD
jgi:hypothetical protein